MQRAYGARWVVFFACVLAAAGCDEEKAKKPIPFDAAADPCAEPVSRCDAGVAGLSDSGAAAEDGGADAGHDAAVAPMEPCGEAQRAQAVYDLCLWARDEDLAELAANPDARTEVEAEVSLGGQRFAEVELELHGGTARTFEKKSYRIRFAGERPSFDFFGDGAEKAERLVLQAAWIDQTFVRAKLVMDLVRELGGLAPRIAFARLHVNGKAVGLYQMIERIDEHYLEGQGFSREGNLYKAENHAANWDVHDDPLAGFAERTNEDQAADDLAQLFRAVKDTAGTHEAFEEQLAPLVSLDDFRVWNWVMSYALNLDTFTKNYYLYHDPQAQELELGGAFRIIHWDADTSFGMWWDGRHYWEPEEAPLYGAKNRLAARLFAIPEYRAPYLQRFRELLDTTFHPDRVGARAASLLDALEPDIAQDRALWQREGSWADERAYLEDNIELRHRVMVEAVDMALTP